MDPRLLLCLLLPASGTDTMEQGVRDGSGSPLDAVVVRQNSVGVRTLEVTTEDERDRETLEYDKQDTHWLVMYAQGEREPGGSLDCLP